ncbi:hypothetical protein [Dictyobacter formicarum]|uniref:Glucose-1-phosphate adenylyltransferase n=1 Tax=Dictyobacter formicarum TaxID=2778368 RepID=A0ABQ3VSX7_9CHLR|nr:hypothetical protein [Dictyobacter formicarum]GHO88488.1 hypothetical protein KSZ_64940 [Dictyobacter formicarum]
MPQVTRRKLVKQLSLLSLSFSVIPQIFALRRSFYDGVTPSVRVDRPIYPQGATPESATFIDPTAIIQGDNNITLGKQVYIAPFAQLLAYDAPISIGSASNVQDSVIIIGHQERDSVDEKPLTASGLDAATGVEIAERCILAHGVTIKGPARIGVGSGMRPVFLSFGAEVDGAILERNTVVSQLARVGPGVRLHSGYVVLPGKNVTTQQQADNTALGKVRMITEADIAFNETVLEVNTSFARVYTRLFQEKASSIEGINYNPGFTHFNPARHLPTFNKIATCLPDFRNRIIGAVNLADTLHDANTAMLDCISLRADEGEPFNIGHISYMGHSVIFHALEHTDLRVGNNIKYGSHAIVHGGLRQPGNKPTVIEDDVVVKDQALVFGSLIGRGSIIGVKSAVINSELAPDTVIPDHVIYLNSQHFGAVEW